jgi:site-specific recombinase XerD
MSVTINFHLNKSSRTKKAKEIAIIGRVSYSYLNEDGSKRESFKFGTGYSAPARGFKAGRVNGSIANASHTNSKLAEYAKKVELLYNQFEDAKEFPSSASFRDQLLSVTKLSSKERNFVEDFESFIQYHENKGSAAPTIRNLKQTLARLKQVALKKKHALEYGAINLEFYAKFIAYCNEVRVSDAQLGLKKNTTGGNIKLLKTFLNYASANGWNKFEYYRHPQFKILTEKISVVCCDEKEIEKLSELNLADRPRLRLNLDFFLLGCETGLRYVDYHKIQPEKIKEVGGGYNLEARTQKTGSDVVIPLSQLAMDILGRYDFQLPEPPSNQTLNYNLKEIMKLAEIGKNISSHDARRSFATNQYKAGTPIQWIMRITGHATERELYKYIGVDLIENADRVRQMHDKYKIEKRGLLNKSKLKIA